MEKNEIKKTKEENVQEELVSLEKNNNEEINTEKNINEDVTQQEILNVHEELKPIKNKDKKIPFIILTIIIIVLAAILYFVYTNIASPKKIFTKAINKSYKEVENFIDESYKNKIDKSMVLSNNVEMNVGIDDSLIDGDSKKIIDEINKMKLNTTLGYDQKNKEMLMTVGALYDNKSLIDLGAYAKNENMYFELKNIFDKYIEVSLDDYDTYFEQSNVDIDDVKYILSKTKDSVINNLDEKSLKKSKETIKIEGKNVKTNKISYVISEQKGHELSKNVLTELVKDSKYIEAIATIKGEDKEGVKEAIEEKIDELTEEIKSGDLETEETVSFVVYTKGLMGETVGYELSFDTDEEKGIVSYYKGKSKNELRVIIEEEELLNATIYDNKYVFKITNDEETVELEILKKKKDKKTTYAYTLTASGASISGDVIIEMIKENKDGSYEADISISASFMGMIEMTISGTSKLEYKDKLDLPDVSNSVSSNEITEEDLNSIKTKLMENETLMSLITKLSGYTNSN